MTHDKCDLTFIKDDQFYCVDHDIYTYRESQPQPTEPTFGSLFAGIGGLDLGLERAGWQPSWQIENDPFCLSILAAHWPTVTRHSDLTRLNFDQLTPVELLAGGFPCQPHSIAGKRLAQDDPRWLWPWFAAAIDAVRPRYVLIENVPGLRSSGLRDVLADLAYLGFDAEWSTLSACSLGAPHTRNRLFVVAYANAARDHKDTGPNVDWAKVAAKSKLPGVIGGPPNPTWIEWLMGFPTGWTDSARWATPSFRRSPSTSAGS